MSKIKKVIYIAALASLIIAFFTPETFADALRIPSPWEKQLMKPIDRSESLKRTIECFPFILSVFIGVYSILYHFMFDAEWFPSRLNAYRLWKVKCAEDPEFRKNNPSYRRLFHKKALLVLTALIVFSLAASYVCEEVYRTYHNARGEELKRQYEYRNPWRYGEIEDSILPGSGTLPGSETMREFDSNFNNP